MMGRERTTPDVLVKSRQVRLNFPPSRQPNTQNDNRRNRARRCQAVAGARGYSWLKIHRRNLNPVSDVISALK
ncbi:hypothetical protein VFPPC_17806 [Pochonia chlamydosporia 170]|uniref:Uncharacterized protein n=1 Tax=Pochonia chlamydosporia 170 TaxID=1380566 RepID=A0A219AQH9_METCM|nr:hypothetical protein VFPPC_17806 [Pochonia chlamydosporia 170]OWT43001.1 hypothetical protein VFPPC_17806 [Pochonia chlamydosporia 170]